MKIIERLRELEKKATGAPWHGKYGDGMYITGPDKKEVATACGCCDGCTGDNCENDRPFIIELRNALPALLAVVEAQAEEIENAREFRNRLVEYTLSYLDAKGERTLDMERRLIAGYSKLKENTDAAIRAMEGGSK